MPSRHRIPTIFNLSMVDVLCCALGCVILLWLLNLREAKQRAAAASMTSDLLSQAKAQLSDTRQRLSGVERQAAETTRALETTRGERDQVLQRALAAEKTRSETQAALQTVRQELDQKTKDLLALRSEYATTAEQLAKKMEEHAAVANDLSGARQRLDALGKLVQEKDAQARTLTRSANDLAERLRDADARLKQVQTQADLLPSARAEAQNLRERAGTLDVRAQALESELRERTRELASARLSVASLQDQKQELAAQVVRTRAAAENRFAGLTLTGRRVVFIVDMSGSMEMVDENTAAPQKWSAVYEAVGKVMRSLPQLDKFQVILFSNRVTYLLGNEDRWLDFEPGTTADRVVRALAAIKPRGNTDMYAAFDAAFRFRADGLDTIYLFSDGLPNAGQGLAPETARNMKETELSEVLGKYVRQTLRTAWNRPTISGTRVRINTVGFFYESPDVGAFLWALARENDGGFAGMSKP